MAGRIAAGSKHVEHHNDAHNCMDSDDEEEKELNPRRQSMTMDELNLALANSKSAVGRAYLDAAIFCRKITISDWFNQSIMACIVVAGILVGIQTYPEFEDDGVVFVFNQIVLYAFTLECALKIVAEGFKPWLYFTGGEWRWNNFDFIIVVVCLPIWGDLFGGGSVAILRLMRLMRVMKIVKKVPQLQMIMMGLIAGMTSIKYILLLLSLILYLFAIAGIYAFRSNDPQHFKTLQLAMLTLFRASTLEDWTDVMYINIYGCDYWYGRSAGYVLPGGSTFETIDGVPQMKVGTICDEDSAQPALTVLYFVLFIVISAFVMLSLFVGAVSMGMADAVDTMKEMEYQQERTKKLEKVKQETLQRRKVACRKMVKHIRSKNLKLQDVWHKTGDTGPVNKEGLLKLLHHCGADERASNGFDIEDVIQQIMICTKQRPDDVRKAQLSITYVQFQQIIDEHENADDENGGSKGFPYNLMLWKKRKSNAEGGQVVNSEERQKRQQLRSMMMKIMKLKDSESEVELREQSQAKVNNEVQVKAGFLVDNYAIAAKWCHWFCNLPAFVNFITFIIVVAGILVGVGTYDGMETNSTLKTLDQIILAIFTFEVVVKIIAENFHPWAYFNSGWNTFDFIIVLGSFLLGGSMITMLRLLRLLRVLKLVKSLPQLQLIVDALVQGLASIGYIGVILLLVFYLFAILGMTLFKKNDPWHFGTLARAMLTLFRCSTLEDWTDVMYINMYGCKNYGYNDHPWECVDSKESWWFALIYFVVFTVLGSLVLLTLFIGVVCTSMAEAQEKQAIEKDVEDRANEIKNSLVKIIHDDSGKTYRLQKPVSKIEKDKIFMVCMEGEDLFHEKYGAEIEFCVPSDQFDTFREVFDMMDIDHGGTIELDELMLALDQIGLKLPKKIAQKLVEEADSDNTGDIDFAEFLKFMTSCRSWADGPPPDVVVTTATKAPKKAFDASTPNKIEEAKSKLRLAMLKVRKCTQKQSTNTTVVTLASESLPLLHQVEIELEELLTMVQDNLPAAGAGMDSPQSLSNLVQKLELPKVDERRSPVAGNLGTIEC